jgi:hypothetical protein
MNKKDILSSIEGRILIEMAKHTQLNWVKIAAHKIYAEHIEIKKIKI